MATELEELNSRLDQLEARLPSIMAMSEGPSEFWASFMKEAEGIEEAAGPTMSMCSSGSRQCLEPME